MITRRSFLSGVSALALAPLIPVAAIEVSSPGIVDRMDFCDRGQGGGIPGIYGCGGRYGGAPQRRGGLAMRRSKWVSR